MLGELLRQSQPTEYREAGKDQAVNPDVPSWQQYTEFRQALSSIYAARPDSPAAFYNQPSSLSRKAREQYLAGQPVDKQAARFYYTDVPNPWDLGELPKERYDRIAAAFGPDIARAKMGSWSVANGSGLLLPVGGACAIETYGLDLVNKSPAYENDQSGKTAAADRMIANAPYYTQVTGTMLQGGNEKVGVMYTEEFPWWLRIQNELGVSDAIPKTQAAYTRIAEATQRRGLLVDPNYQQLTLPFDTLRLEEDGHLQEWYQQCMQELPEQFRQFIPPMYDENGFLASWVRYTYNGPNMLDIVKTRIRDQYGISLDAFTTHVRTKQLDHLKEPTFLFKNAASLTERDRELLGKYGTIAGLAIDSWHMQNSDKGQTGFIGFDDLSLGGDLIHQTVPLGNGTKKLPKTAAEAEAVLASPVRLHQKNVDQHMLYLEQSLYPEVDTAREVVKKQESLIGMEKNFVNQQKQTKIMQVIDTILKSAVANTDGVAIVPVDSEELESLFFEESDVFPRDTATVIRNEITDRLRIYTLTKDVQATLRNEGLIPDNIWNRFAIYVTEQKQKNGSNLVVQFADSQSQSLLPTYSTMHTEAVAKQEKQEENLGRAVEAKQAEFAALVDGVGETLVAQGQALKGIPEMPILPLADNMIVSHAVQLSFDPDMRAFVTDAAAIARQTTTNEEKTSQLREAMAQIFPKIKSYLEYIMKGGVYPAQRFVRTYAPVI